MDPETKLEDIPLCPNTSKLFEKEVHNKRYIKIYFDLGQQSAFNIYMYSFVYMNVK